MDGALLSLMALSRVPMVGPVLGRILISYCGSPEAVFRQSLPQLSRIPQIGETIARNLRDPSVHREAEQEWRTLEKEGIRAITYLDPAYPSRLRHFEESPLLLYVRGQPDLQAARTVGVIGTRTPTAQGKMFTEELVKGLKPYGVLVVSGMAHGVDSYAHHAALQECLPTIGILGHGFHTLYPAAHRHLASRMSGDSGLLTEFSWNTRPDKENFPMRNRVIAAMSDALVVVESREKGGSMITAEFANRFNKDVFAVPGRIQDPCSRGCNLLIKSHKAHLIESTEDLALFMRWDPVDDHAGRTAQGRLFHDLEEDEEKMVQLLRENPEWLIDDLGFKLRMTPGNVSALLLRMEFKGIVHTLPGKRYALAPGVSIPG